MHYGHVGGSHVTIYVQYLLFTYMAQNVMILLRAKLLQGPLEGVGPENRDFFGP